MVKNINEVIVWPEGKEVAPLSVLPTITKLSTSKIAAGLGMAKIFLRMAEENKVNMEDVIIDSHNLGTLYRNINANGKITNASPRKVIL